VICISYIVVGHLLKLGQVSMGLICIEKLDLKKILWGNISQDQLLTLTASSKLHGQPDCIN